MKILSLTYEYPPIGGGGSVVASALNETLAGFGEDIQVVTSAMPGLKETEHVNGVLVHRAPCWRRHRHFTTSLELATTLLPAYLRAARVIKEFKPDLIHTHFVFPSGVLAYLLSRRFDIPYVLTAHGSDIPGYNPDRFGLLHAVLKPLWRRIVGGAAAITSPSKFLAELIQRNTQVPVDIVPNGFSPSPRPPVQKRNLVLVVARLFPRKGVQHFIEAAHRMGGDWEFVVAGDGPYMETLKQQAKSLNCPVRFVGFIDKTTLYGLYQEARIFVFPSLRENFPMVLLEAMDAGCAVITTDAEGCAEVVGNAGIVVKAGSARQIRAALSDLMANPDRVESLSAVARQRAQGYRWPRIAEMYRHVFYGALGLRTGFYPRPAEFPAAKDKLATTGTFATRRHPS